MKTILCSFFLVLLVLSFGCKKHKANNGDINYTARMNGIRVFSGVFDTTIMTMHNGSGMFVEHKIIDTTLAVVVNDAKNVSFLGHSLVFNIAASTEISNCYMDGKSYLMYYFQKNSMVFYYYSGSGNFISAGMLLETQ